jgi:membrane-associated phospholipid phosphatase
VNATVAKIITYILQPLIMPFFGVLFLLYFDEYYYLQTTPTQKFYILAFIFLLTFVLPALAAILLKSLGVIKTLMMETREERKMPILVTAFIYVAVFFMIGQMPGYYKIRIFILATTMAIILCGFITNYYKISMHMTGCGGVIGWLLYMSTYSLINLWWLLAICILASGLVGTARLRLKAHTPLQVYTGFLFGTGVVYGVSLWLI